MKISASKHSFSSNKWKICRQRRYVFHFFFPKSNWNLENVEKKECRTTGYYGMENKTTIMILKNISNKLVMTKKTEISLFHVLGKSDFEDQVADVSDFFHRHEWLHEKILAVVECQIKKIRNGLSGIPGFVTYFYSLKQNGVELGKWLPVLPAPPHTTEKRRRGEVCHVYGQCTDLGGLRFQLMTLQLKLRADKISKTM